jgi:hypothetical protein
VVLKKASASRWHRACQHWVEEVYQCTLGLPDGGIEESREIVSRIQFHIERIKEICTEIRDIKERHEEERLKHSKTTSPKGEHKEKSEVNLRTTYKYKVGNKDIHDQHVQDHIYSKNRKRSHRKLLDDKRNNRHVYEECPTQRLSSLTPVRPKSSHASPPSPPADIECPSSPPFDKTTVSPADPSTASWNSSLPLSSSLSETLQREGTESFKEGVR